MIGTSANEVSLTGTSLAESWGLSLDTSVIEHASVRDSNALNGFAVDATNNCIDMGNNANWVFSDNQLDSLKLSFSTEDYVFKDSGSIVIEAPEASGNYNIYYTLDGTNPNAGSLVYMDPIAVEETTEVRAIIIFEEGTVDEISSQVQSSIYYKVDIEDVYPIKSYGMGAIIYTGDVRRFAAQAYWVGPDGVPDELGNGDDVRIKDFEQYITWSSTGGSISADGVSEDGAHAIFRNGVGGYTVTCKINGNSFSGCNNACPEPEPTRARTRTRART